MICRHWINVALEFAKTFSKLKLHSRGFYELILGAVTVLKILQTLALDFSYICLQLFPGNFSRQEKKFLRTNV